MKKKYVQLIIDFIEEHVEEPISLKDIALYLGYSRNYIHKLFYIYTGMYIMEYTRKRKLEYAIQDLKSDKTILEIALAYSYGSERAFSRSFKNVYGISPGKYRHNTCVMKKKLELTKIGGINMLPYLSEPKVVTLKEMHAIGCSIISKTPEFDVIDYMTDFKIKNQIPTFTEIGFDIPVSSEALEEGYRGYEQWLVVDEENAVNFSNDDVKHKVVPHGKYLMLTISDPFLDPFERITTGWKKLVSAAEEENLRTDEICGSEVYGFEEKVCMMHRIDMNLFLKIVE